MFTILHIILYILSIIAESLVYTITLPNNLAIAALQFQLILQARWNLLLLMLECCLVWSKYCGKFESKVNGEG
jgi:hypothetical protein